MRVLQVMEATIGGTRRHLRDVSIGLAAAGHDVHAAVATRRDPDFPVDLDLMRAAGVTVWLVDMGRELSPRADYKSYRELRRLLRRLEPDIVHTHSSKAGAVGRAASIRTKIGRRVHTPHTFAFLFEDLFSRKKRAVFRQIEARLARRTDRIIAVSEGEAATFRRSGVVPDDKIRVVRNAIDVGPFVDAQPLDLEELGLDAERPTAVVIGLVYRAKGQDLLLEALPDHPDLQIVFAGPGDLTELRSLADRYDVEERVRFLGPRRDVPALLAASDFLVLPSRWEGMPYVVLEAMAASRPVVATPVDGAAELVQPGVTGELADAISATALSGALGRLLARDSQELHEFGERALEVVRRDFSSAGMIAGLDRVYDEALSSESTAS